MFEARPGLAMRAAALAVQPSAPVRTAADAARTRHAGADRPIGGHCGGATPILRTRPIAAHHAFPGPLSCPSSRPASPGMGATGGSVGAWHAVLARGHERSRRPLASLLYRVACPPMHQTHTACRRLPAAGQTPTSTRPARRCRSTRRGFGARAGVPSERPERLGRAYPARVSRESVPCPASRE